MERREFLKRSAGGFVAGAAASSISAPAAQAAENASPTHNSPAVLVSLTAEDHRRRLQNIAFCRDSIRTCLRTHLVSDYMPGQACYNLCEYPSKERWSPNDYDERELDRLRDHGIQLIQVFDDWNDSLRLFGGHKLSAVNPEGFRRFVDMVHARGMKIIAYVSTGFLQRTDPDFRPEWSREGDVLELGFWNMARCQPSSAGWRAYVLPRIINVIDEYGVDGLYDDCGYVTNAHRTYALEPTSDEVHAFEESKDFDGALTDMLALIYGEVKRRGGIFKLHINADERPPTRDVKVYDYLWVGEGVSDVERLREETKNYDPYVVPFIDLNFAKIDTDDDPYLHAIPYMQFPVLAAGRPFTGERGMVPGVPYMSQDDFWMQRCRAAWEQYQAHPDGPYTYSAWDAIPAQPGAQTANAKWLKQYLPMVEEGTRAWLEIGDSDLFEQALPQGVVASAFANRDVYLVLANYNRDAAEITTRREYAALGQPGAAPQRNWKVPARSLQIAKLL